jgi:hypothetical protein
MLPVHPIEEVAMPGGVELSEFLNQLRLELQVLSHEAADQSLQLVLDSLEVELHVAVTKAANAEAKAKFWVFEVGGVGGSVGQTATQIIKLKMTPRRPDQPDRADGKPAPVPLSR